MPRITDELDPRGDDRELFDLDEELELEDDLELARTSFRIAGDETDEEELAERDLLDALDAAAEGPDA